MRVFVDTNLLVRLFVKDDIVQCEWAHDLFGKAERGEVDLITGPPVFFELAWVLKRRYGIDREKVLDYLEAAATFSGLKITDEELVANAIACARETGSDFADSYIAVSSTRAKADCIATFNERHFTRLGVGLYDFEK